MSRRRGLVLLELVAAFLVLTVAGVSIAATLRAEAGLARRIYEERLAWEAAAGQIELMEARASGRLEAGTSELSLDFPGWENLPAGKCVRTVSPLGTPGLFRVVVQVSWTGWRDRRQEVEAATLLGEAP